MSEQSSGRGGAPGAEGWYQDPLTECWWDGVAWTDTTRVVGQPLPDGPIVDPDAAVRPGWYPDPRMQRRWNGTSWTGQTRRLSVVDQPRERNRRWALLAVATAAAVVLATGIVTVVVLGGGDESTVAEPTTPLAAPTTTATPTTTAPPTTTATPTTTAPPTSTAPTTTTIPPIVDHPYFRALARWDEAGAVDMLGASRTGSPAWAYARNLQQGFRAGASPTGISTVRALRPDTIEHCIGARCFTLADVEVTADVVVSFSVDGSPIDNRVVGWSLGDVWTCWYFGADQGCPATNAVTMNLTSIYRVPGSTFVSVEVQAGNSTPGAVVFESMSVLDSTGAHLDTNAVAEPVRLGENGVWMLVTGDLDVSSVWEVSIGARIGSNYKVWSLSPDAFADTPSSPATPSSEASAREYLDTLIDGDRARLDRLVGTYLPQLSAKQYDWFEPTTGQYFDWRAILDDHLAFRSRRHGAILMAPYEYSDAPSPWFRTLVPVEFFSENGVRGWCESNGYQWGVTCISRRID